MPQTCPYCGIVLPAVVDAFCPDCRAELDESQEESQEEIGPLAAVYGIIQAAYTAILLVTGALLALSTTVMQAVVVTVIFASVGLAVASVIRARRKMVTTVSGRGKTFRSSEKPK